jgi:hypothetical protein
MAEKAYSTSRRAVLTGIALVLSPTAIAAAPISAVQREAVGFYAASDGRALITAFNAVMAAPATDIDDLIVKLRVGQRFQELAGGWTIQSGTAHAMYRDVARMAGAKS